MTKINTLISLLFTIFIVSLIEVILPCVLLYWLGYSTVYYFPMFLFAYFLNIFCTSTIICIIFNNLINLSVANIEVLKNKLTELGKI